MTAKEFYLGIGGNYDDAVALLHERGLEKILRMLAADENFNVLCNSYGNGDYEKAFIAAHTLKGIFLNLHFDELSEYASRLTEALRNGVSANADAAYTAFTTRCAAMLKILNEYIDSCDGACK